MNDASSNPSETGISSEKGQRIINFIPLTEPISPTLLNGVAETLENWNSGLKKPSQYTLESLGQMSAALNRLSFAISEASQNLSSMTQDKLQPNLDEIWMDALGQFGFREVAQDS